MPQLKAFLFDFNATLIRSKPWMALEMRDLPRRGFAHLAEQGYLAPLSEAQLAEAEAVFKAERVLANETWFETSHVDNLAAMVEALGLGAQVPAEAMEATVAALQRACVPTVTLIEGAAETLQQLQGQGYRLAIISNAAYSPFLLWTLEHLGIRDFFEEVVVSADVGLRKPNLEIFHLTLNRMRLAPTEIVYVGDDFEKDVIAAKKIGARAVWFYPEGSQLAGVEDESLPDAIVRQLSEIPPLAEQWRLTGSEPPG